jgi:hypothetical protein
MFPFLNSLTDGRSPRCRGPRVGRKARLSPEGLEERWVLTVPLPSLAAGAVAHIITNDAGGPTKTGNGDIAPSPVQTPPTPVSYTATGAGVHTIVAKM